jgi:hypothetical protein
MRYFRSMITGIDNAPARLKDFSVGMNMGRVTPATRNVKNPLPASRLRSA